MDFKLSKSQSSCSILCIQYHPLKSPLHKNSLLLASLLDHSHDPTLDLTENKTVLIHQCLPRSLLYLYLVLLFDLALFLGDFSDFSLEFGVEGLLLGVLGVEGVDMFL